ncbi:MULTISPECIES: hypothetical protein [Paenibacillus]|uniref:Uncharacterized protein n=1 Tax=Paenibacillus pabuli TaxID=1472 RepID=A0A855Y4D5_9BACL|nr:MULTISPECIES: hypothetical protein [Paenibacillus]PWW34307.1 hypothetical protein DET56_11519 [Paenibacillus pabuli]PXW00728.1 hypothetical protein DEU73_11419 [Paenibacillus taichungensis]QLG40300.1 hypothetical protein HW560_20745 [Paenibacillus sp. E222]SEN76031.1 hypothetical protein SAMN05518670_2644 [Paenibacillus sp. OK076]
MYKLVKIAAYILMACGALYPMGIFSKESLYFTLYPGLLLLLSTNVFSVVMKPKTESK